MYRGADVNTLHNVILKQSLGKLFEESVKTIREQWHARILNFLLYYRSHSGPLPLTDELGLLPLLTLCTMKHPAFSLHHSSADGRLSALFRWKSIPVVNSFLLTYPRIYRLHDLVSQPHSPGLVATNGMVALPTLVPASSAMLQTSGAYLLDNGEELYIFVGPEVDHGWVEAVKDRQAFGVKSVAEVRDVGEVPRVETETAQRLGAVVDELHRRNPGAYQPLHLVAGEPST